MTAESELTASVDRLWNVWLDWAAGQGMAVPEDRGFRETRAKVWEGSDYVAGIMARYPETFASLLGSGDLTRSYRRGELDWLLILKRRSDAIRDGDRIRGLIRGWSVNQDGRSTGLTTPNVLSQQAMLRQALERAKLTPADIGYVEMHGTGTSLGDPIEAEALREVLGKPRSDASQCVLGAVKTNIGHLEGAAGVAGIIKVALALEHEKIPKNLHFRHLNPRISLTNTPLVVPSAAIAWPRSDKKRFAGVSSFGISGTNAHIIMEEAPLPRTRRETWPQRSVRPCPATTPVCFSTLPALRR